MLPCFFGGRLLALGAQLTQTPHDVAAGLGRHDHRVDIAAFGRGVRVEQRVLVLLDELRAQLLALLVGFDRRERAAVQDVDRALRAHDGDLGGGPGEVEVGAQVLGAHDVVRAAERLAGDDGDQRDRRLRVGVDQLGAAADDAVVLLVDAGQEAGHVHEGDHRHVEGVAGAHEARGLLARRRCRGSRRTASAGWRRCRPGGPRPARSR